MTTTATQLAIDALALRLTTAAGTDLRLLPPSRNRTVETMLSEIADSVEAHLNLADGEQIEAVELLGAGEPEYEIEHQAVVQFVMTGHDRNALDARFAEALRAVEDAIATDRTLGGMVADTRLTSPEITNGRAGEAGRPWKAAEIPVIMLFAANQPY